MKRRGDDAPSGRDNKMTRLDPINFTTEGLSPNVNLRDLINYLKYLPPSDVLALLCDNWSMFGVPCRPAVDAMIRLCAPQFSTIWLRRLALHTSAAAYARGVQLFGGALQKKRMNFDWQNGRTNGLGTKSDRLRLLKYLMGVASSEILVKLMQEGPQMYPNEQKALTEAMASTLIASADCTRLVSFDCQQYTHRRANVMTAHDEYQAEHHRLVLLIELAIQVGCSVPVRHGGSDRVKLLSHQHGHTVDAYYPQSNSKSVLTMTAFTYPDTTPRLLTSLDMGKRRLEVMLENVQMVAEKKAVLMLRLPNALTHIVLGYSEP
jgi:hypothetical protein